MRRFVIALIVSTAFASPAFAGNWGAIDCGKAKTADEKTICANVDLVQRDAQMSAEYGLLKGFLMMGGRGALMDEQKDWLGARRTCGADVACLRKAYDDRIAVLEAGFQRVASFGPF